MSSSFLLDDLLRSFGLGNRSILTFFGGQGEMAISSETESGSRLSILSILDKASGKLYRSNCSNEN
jgi:hypothetical protein